MIQGLLTNLRAIELDDTPLVYDWLNNPVVMDGWGFDIAVISRTITAERISGWIDQERTCGRPVAFIIERALDRGAIGLLVGTPADQERRVAYLSLLIGDPAEWGQGYGQDALDAYVAAAFDGWNLHRLELEVEAGNARAERLYKAAGFTEEAVWRQHRLRSGVRCDVRMMGLLQSEWRERHAPDADSGNAQDPEELFDVLHADGEPKGHVKPRWQVHRDGDWHRSIHIWFCGVAGGEPFLDFQLRGAHKDTWPNRLDATVGGHLRAGETVAEAHREIEEELGIIIEPGDVVHAGTRRAVSDTAPGARDCEIQEVYLVRRDAPLTEYRPNQDEVDGLRRVAIGDAIELFTGGRERIPAQAIVTGASEATEVELTTVDFIPTIDRYFLRIAVAARRFLAEEFPVIV